MRKLTLFVSAAALFITPPAGAKASPDAASLQSTVEKLVSFGTRHTLSSPDHPTRGIGAARRWAADEFKSVSKGCGGCLTVENIERVFSGPRAPDGVNVVNVLAVQMGKRGWDHVIIVAGHIDSRVTDPMNFTDDAPGANDDGSGTALVMEAARVLAGEEMEATIVYALLSGEEQGLWGGTLLAEIAKKRGWKVSAMLNNDIVGNSVGTDGRVVADRVRVFSEGIRASEDIDAMMARRGSGGEDDGPSRALMRAAERAAERNDDLRLEVFGVRRPDRFRRGGDHLPALELGFPAVRFTVGVENYVGQHQDLRSEDGLEYGDTVDKMDFDYLTRVTALNIATIRELGAAPAAPDSASLGGAVSSDTIVNWQAVEGAAGYKVYWRRSDQRDWEDSRMVSADQTSLKLEGVIVDDYFAGVAAVSASGAESIVTFAGLPPRE
ncbi:M28 family metallopeptidase [Sphingorhabdus arenilitoris]|uniref:M28 family metallopeptidase n=1 Tax=Sphingorhabdus arenilitoris TaxID=1490041 RepID=A0ABV8RJ36_9SPHN